MARRIPASTDWPPPVQEPQACALCERVTPTLTAHHLIPRSQGRRLGARMADLPVVNLCSACHRFLHKTFTNAELAREFNAIDTLLEQDSVRRFVAWVRKQPVTKGVRVR